ncbi:MAG: response regulator [Candidatus Rokubacteria bacterium]|nr:response regulator [Candidatus Rokubacteria bacterium]
MSRKILLVDDEVAICESLKGLLSDQGHQVSYATNGDAAVAKAADADLAICDLRLGDESGLQVIERLKAARPNLKILVFSAYPSIDALQAATDLGVEGFLTKPLGMPELLVTVDRCLGGDVGPVMLFPAALREKIADIMPALSEVTIADGTNWLRVRTQIRSVAPAAVLVDGGAAEAIDFLDACRRELEGRTVFFICRDEDFNTAR